MKYLLPLIIAFSILINPINTYAEELILAGGCFWCLEHDLEPLKGVNFVKSGYSGGDLQNPTYELSLIHIWRCRRLLTCRSRWSPYH